MSKIGTLEDFRKFALDKTKIGPSAFDDKIKNMVYPTIVEERESSIRSIEMNVFSRLVQDRVIYFSGEVDQLSCDTIIAQLLYLSSVDERDINLYINSPGGEVISGLGLIDTMNYIKCDVATTCIGMAASMGAVLLSNGTKGKRFVLPHSRVMIHQVSSANRGTLKDMEIELQQTIRCKKDLYTILSENTNKSFEQIEKDCDRNFWLIGQEAVDYNIADVLLSKKS